MFTVELSFWQVFFIGFTSGIFSVAAFMTVLAIRASMKEKEIEKNVRKLQMHEYFTEGE